MGIQFLVLSADADAPEITQLREWFKDEPIFAEVIDTIMELDQGASLWTEKKGAS